MGQLANNVVDLSFIQKSSSIDWPTFSKYVSFLILRDQYGTTIPDKEYKNHVANAKKYGLKAYTYAFLEFISEQDARVEANSAVDRADADSMGIMMDIEAEFTASGQPVGLARLTPEVRKAGIIAYVDQLRKRGIKRVGAYVGHNIYSAWDIAEIIHLFDFVMIPRYGVNDGQPHTKPDFPCDIWQFTSQGRIPGYNGDLDISCLNGGKTMEWFLGIEPQPAANTLTAPNTEWKKENGVWHYYQNGQLKKGCWILYKAKWYYLNADGSMAQGWVQYNKKWYYLNPAPDRGEMLTGWITDKGKKYYCDPQSGDAYIGKHTIDGKVYQFAIDCSLIQ